MAQGFDTYFDRFDPREQVPTTSLASSERPGNEVLEPALEWIGEQGGRLLFCFIHFVDPHTPYAPPEPYRSRYGPETLGLYDGEVAFADALVGNLVSALEKQKRKDAEAQRKGLPQKKLGGPEGRRGW